MVEPMKALGVGDYITDTTSIYKVIAIKNELVYYEPMIKRDKVFSSYIPLKNLKKAGLRKVITKSEAVKIMEGLVETVAVDQYDFNMAKEEVYRNEPDKVIPILFYIRQHSADLSKNDKDLSEVIEDSLTREISFVTDEKMEEVRKLFDQKLSQNS